MFWIRLASCATAARRVPRLRREAFCLASRAGKSSRMACTLRMRQTASRPCCSGLGRVGKTVVAFQAIASGQRAGLSGTSDSRASWAGQTGPSEHHRRLPSSPGAKGLRRMLSCRRILRMACLPPAHPGCSGIENVASVTLRPVPAIWGALHPNSAAGRPSNLMPPPNPLLLAMRFGGRFPGAAWRPVAPLNHDLQMSCVQCNDSYEPRWYSSRELIFLHLSRRWGTIPVGPCPHSAPCQTAHPPWLQRASAAHGLAPPCSSGRSPDSFKVVR